MDKNFRTIELDGEPWFVAADVCRILDIYQNSNDVAGRVKSRLGKDEWRLETLVTPHPRWVGKQTRRQALVVSESGLYTLIMRSDKDTARPFQDWEGGESTTAVVELGSTLGEGTGAGGD